MWRNLTALPRYRGLIQSLVARDLKARYRGSVLGFFWSFVNPLMLLIIYSVVFEVFLPNRTEGIQPYALFLFSGLLPWTWFSTALNESAGVLIVGGNLIKKVLFPAEVLPIVAVLANMIHFFFGLPILAGFLAYYAWGPASIDPATGLAVQHQIALHWGELIWLPVVIFVQFVLTTGLAFLLSSLTVHFRDIRDILANMLTFWFFATPIIYWWKTPALLRYKWFFDLNPFTHLAVSYQEILFFPENAFGHWKWLLALGGASVVIFLIGYWVFDRLRDSFAEVV
jgi:homopolymeric O-antigen transport system permease protein